MLNRRQKGIILLAPSLFGSVYMMLTDSGSLESPSQLLVVLWIIVLAAFGIYLLFVAED